MKRVLFIITLIASLVFLVLFVVYSCTNLYFALASLPFVIFVSTAVHEAGHVIGCKILNGKVYEYRVSYVQFSNGKLSLADEGFCTFHVRFSVPKKSYIVYLSGIIFSILLSAVLTAVYFLFLRYTLFYIISGATILNVILPLIYFKGSDIYRCFNHRSGEN